MDVNSALQDVLKPTLMHEGLARGIGDATKASDKCQARPCVLASNRDEPMYFRPVEAHCDERQINLVKADHKKPGQWVGCLRTMAKDLRPRMSARSTSNARNE